MEFSQSRFFWPVLQREEMLRRSRDGSQGRRQCFIPGESLDSRTAGVGAMVEDFCDLARLIRSLQRLEGKPECFGTGQPSCESIGCTWSEYCLKPEGGTVAYCEQDFDKRYE